MFNVPHLVKCTWNIFFKHKFVIQEGFINQIYLDQFWEKDKNLRLCPKLTDDV